MVSYSVNSQALLKALGQFPKNIQNNVMTGAVRAGANVVRDDARARVHKKTHNLERSIATTKRRGEGNITHFSVSPTRGGAHDGWYAHFLEFGTSHSQPFPFLRPAIEANVNNVLTATKQYMSSRIDEEVRKAK